jgi:hypothetical protein
MDPLYHVIRVGTIVVRVRVVRETLIIMLIPVRQKTSRHDEAGKRKMWSRARLHLGCRRWGQGRCIQVNCPSQDVWLESIGGGLVAKRTMEISLSQVWIPLTCLWARPQPGIDRRALHLSYTTAQVRQIDIATGHLKSIDRRGGGMVQGHTVDHRRIPWRCIGTCPGDFV